MQSNSSAGSLAERYGISPNLHGRSVLGCSPHDGFSLCVTPRGPISRGLGKAGTGPIAGRFFLELDPQCWHCTSVCGRFALDHSGLRGAKRTRDLARTRAGIGAARPQAAAPAEPASQRREALTHPPILPPRRARRSSATSVGSFERKYIESLGQRSPTPRSDYDRFLAARRAQSASRSLRRVLLTPQVNPGSLYRGGKRD